jgi:hypothetical protein
MPLLVLETAYRRTFVDPNLAQGGMAAVEGMAVKVVDKEVAVMVP